MCCSLDFWIVTIASLGPYTRPPCLSQGGVSCQLLIQNKSVSPFEWQQTHTLMHIQTFDTSNDFGAPSPIGSDETIPKPRPLYSDDLRLGIGTNGYCCLWFSFLYLIGPWQCLEEIGREFHYFARSIFAIFAESWRWTLIMKLHIFSLFARV